MIDEKAGAELNMSGGKLKVPLNSMFLTCVYGHYLWDFEKAPVHDSKTHVLSKIFCHGEFYLELRKVSSAEFKVSLNRLHHEPSKLPDPGYFLEILFIVPGHKELTKRKFMDCITDCVYNVYEYSGVDSYTRESKIWTVQCVVYMHEFFALPTKAAKRQNNLIKASVEDVTRCNAAVGMMESVLPSPEPRNIFSGRQDYAFAPLKADFIERDLNFTCRFEKRLKAENVKFPSDVYLCYVLKSDFKPIDKNEVLTLYTLAQHLGLCRVVDACRNFMLRHLDDEYLIHVLEHSVGTCDFKLIPKAITPFVQNMGKVTKTRNWRILELKKPHTARCIMRIAQQSFDDFVSEEFAKSDELYGRKVESLVMKSPSDNIETMDVN